jgi:hypothetical protein
MLMIRSAVSLLGPFMSHVADSPLMDSMARLLKDSHPSMKIFVPSIDQPHALSEQIACAIPYCKLLNMLGDWHAISGSFLVSFLYQRMAIAYPRALLEVAAVWLGQ